MSSLCNLTALLALACLSTAAAACSNAAPDDDGAASSDSALTETNQTGIDAQVLQVWTPGRLFPRAAQPWQGMGPHDVSIDAEHVCTVLETNSWSHWVDTKVDCTSAFAAAAPFDVTHAAGPVMTPVRFTV